MPVLNPYLNFNGNTEEVFNFYKSVFGGEFAMVLRFKDTAETAKVPEADQNKIMHIALPIGKHSVLMGTDALESAGQTVTMGTSSSISVSTDSKAEADKLFNGLAAGATVTLPMQDMFWGSYFGMLTDRFGVQWMISYDEKQPHK